MSEADTFKFHFIGVRKDAIACMSFFDRYLKFVFQLPEAPLKLRTADYAHLAHADPSTLRILPM